LPLDVGKDVVDGLLKRMDMEKQIKLFIDLSSLQGISHDLCVAVYTREETIHCDLCMEKAHGRYIKSFFS